MVFSNGFHFYNIQWLPPRCWGFGEFIDPDYEKQFADDFDEEGYSYRRQVSKARSFFIGCFVVTHWTK